MAQILVEAPFGSNELEGPETAPTVAAKGEGEPAVAGLLAELVRRFQEKRLRELAGEIGEAQRRGGDAALLTRLYDEKRRLSLSFHRRPGSGAGRGAG